MRDFYFDWEKRDRSFSTAYGLPCQAIQEIE